jgi:hypothetical protein
MEQAPLKLVVSGTVGAGKTTFIRSLSEIPVVDTDALASEAIGKTQTTVAMDFGTMTLDGLQLHLYGTPGQDRFDFMWDILVEGALGLVLLVAGDRPQDLPRARHILEYLTSRHPVPFIIGVTKQDLPRVWGPDEIGDYFGLGPEQVIGLNALQAVSAEKVLLNLLQLLETD